MPPVSRQPEYGSPSPASFAQPVRSLRLQADAIEALARADIERALVGPGKRDVRGLTRHLDRAEIFAAPVEDLDAADGGHVQPTIAIHAHAVGAALLARLDVVQLHVIALVLDASIGLDVVGEDSVTDGVVDDQGLAVARKRNAVRARGLL